MKSNLIKNVLLGTATFCALAGVAQTASAAAPSGTCGLIATMPRPELDWSAWIAGARGPLTKNMDLLAEINFTASTIDYSVTQFTYAGGVAGAFSKVTVSGHAAFVLTGPGTTTPAVTTTTPNSYQITFTPTGVGATEIILNVLPVNSGKTFLIQGVADRLSGVCQSF